MKRGTALSHAKGYRLLDLLRTHLKLALSHTPPVPSPFPRSAKPACRLSRWPAAVEREPSPEALDGSSPELGQPEGNRGERRRREAALSQVTKRKSPEFC